ncbi:21315_t:CDS:2 [Dentiscutata erythropus]|uniref:21315_t:CDS:1 n=1 Tax=Dentiscutata erythropus TaxID=1348616 RepID=A0A9N9FJB2_9GLOM|nr:21315_t:CDS:2 [Dentiscutata erythropus]
MEVEVIDAKREREVAVKAVLESECTNYLYEYLILRKEQASFIENSQTEHAKYFAELTRQQNFNERAQLALNAFEKTLTSKSIRWFTFVMIRWFRQSLFPSSKQEHPLVCSCDNPLVLDELERKSPAVSRLWSEVAEKLTQFANKQKAANKQEAANEQEAANKQEASTKDMNLSHKRGIEVMINDEKNGSYKKWEVDNINVTNRFRQYQKAVLAKAQKWGLKYSSIYELLALASIMVLCWPCPYSNFTNQEWKKITTTNPYTLQESPLPPEISLSLREAASRRLINGDVFMNSSESELSRIVALTFNLYYGAPSKLSEEEHCDMFIYPIARSFRRNDKEYELKLNRANFKPLGYTPLQEKMDRLKVQLKARKSINQQLQRKGGPGEAVMFLSIGNSMESFFMDLKCDGYTAPGG